MQDDVAISTFVQLLALVLGSVSPIILNLPLGKFDDGVHSFTLVSTEEPFIIIVTNLSYSLNGDIMRNLAFLLIFSLLVSSAIAHPGRTDSKGGHFNKATGQYHYHNSKSSKTPDSNAPAVKQTVNKNENIQKTNEPNLPTVRKLQSEINALRTDNEKLNELINQLKTTCITLKKENKIMKQMLVDANMPLPKIVNNINDNNNPDSSEPNNTKIKTEVAVLKDKTIKDANTN